MIGFSTILSVCVTLIITLFLPIIFIIMYAHKNKGNCLWSAWGLGATGFVLFYTSIKIGTWQKSRKNE